MTALYIRLSKEDAQSAESASVKNQRAILRERAGALGLTELCEYVDDGFSGTNTDRPGFCALMRDIECGVIDTVIVKDLSRLARNSNDANELIDEYFPLHNVRFISVGESIDTSNSASSVILAPLANMMHEFYSRDISSKIRAALYNKMDNGIFVGARAPFGYSVRSGRLIPDENADTVRAVFSLAAEGVRPGGISERLGISPERIRAMIRNDVYTGVLRQGKTKKLSFKSKKSVKVPYDLRHVALNAHEAIIDKKLFDTANRYLDKRTGEKSGFCNIFSGVAYCADCGARMTTVGTRRKGSPCALACARYKQRGRAGCTNHHIDYKTLYDTVRSELERELAGYYSVTELDAKILFALISRIEIYQGRATHQGREQKIHIVYKFAACH